MYIRELDSEIFLDESVRNITLTGRLNVRAPASMISVSEKDICDFSNRKFQEAPDTPNLDVKGHIVRLDKFYAGPILATPSTECKKHNDTKNDQREISVLTSKRIPVNEIFSSNFQTNFEIWFRSAKK